MENQVTNVLIFLLVCLVFAVSSAFPIMSWMTNIGGVDRCNILQTSAANPVLKTSSVGIYLLQTPYPSDGNLPDPFLTMADPFLNITAGGLLLAVTLAFCYLLFYIRMTQFMNKVFD
jgi:hypothetical protein